MGITLLFDEGRDQLFIVLEAPFKGNKSSMLINTDEGERPVHLLFNSARPKDGQLIAIKVDEARSFLPASLLESATTAPAETWFGHE